MLEANYLTILLTPNYEKPVDTPEDILGRGLNIIRSYISTALVEDMKKSPFPLTRALGERSIVPKVIFYFVRLKNVHSNINFFYERIQLNMTS